MSSILTNADYHCLSGTFWYHSHLSTQYCDGLRGPFVVYDPQDPHASLYDVDDGKFVSMAMKTKSDIFPLDSTVITLSDWYHVAAKLGPRFPSVELHMNRTLKLIVFHS